MINLRGFGRPINEASMFQEIATLEDDLDSFEMPTPEETKAIDGMCSAAGIGDIPRSATFADRTAHFWRCPLCRKIYWKVDSLSSTYMAWWEKNGATKQKWNHNGCPTSVIEKRKKFYNLVFSLRVSKLVNDRWLVNLSTRRSNRAFMCDGLGGVQTIISATVAPFIKELNKYEQDRKALAGKLREMRAIRNRVIGLGKSGKP